MHMLRRLATRLTCLLLCAGVTAVSVQAQAVSEYALKAALLFKLPKFVYRPGAERDPTIELCVLGRNPFDSALERLAQTPIEDRPVNVLKLTTVIEAGGCDFVFIARSEAESLDGVLRRLAGYPVVTVSDIEGFARAGGMVEFSMGNEGNAVGIHINRKAARARNIEFNAQLLRLARVIEP